MKNQSKIRYRTFQLRTLGDAGAIACAELIDKPSLRKLWIGRQDVGDAGAAALAARLPGSGLRELRLWFNRIGDAGASALVERFDIELFFDFFSQISKLYGVRSLLYRRPILQENIRWNSYLFREEDSEKGTWKETEK